MKERFIPSAAGLRALAEANPGITQNELAKKIGCNAAHLGTQLEKAGIQLRHGRRSDATTDRHALSHRKIPPARKPVLRPCITCGSSFRSEHVGNRMCVDCRRNWSE